MEVRYQDEAQKISLIGYADTLIMDSRQTRLVGIRVGGYPEVVSGLSAAICGGGTVTVSTPDGSLLCTAERGRYCKTMSREGAYAVATILWDQNAARKTGTGKEEHENEKEDDENRQKSSSQPQEYYLLCAAGDRDALYREIDHVGTIPMIPQFADYLIDELQARGILTQCMVHSVSEPFEAWRLICTAGDSNIADVITDGLKSGAIRIPGTQPGQSDAFRDITGVSGYLSRFGAVIAARIRNQFRPLYDPAEEALSEEVLELNRFVEQTAGYSLYGAQLAAAEALRRRLQTARFGLLIAECGSGKSKVGSLALQAYFLQKHRKCLHLVLAYAHGLRRVKQVAINGFLFIFVQQERAVIRTIPPPMGISRVWDKVSHRNAACPVDFQNLPLLRFLDVDWYAETQPLCCLTQDFFRGCVQQKSLIVKQAQWVIAHNKPDGILAVQHRKHKRALDILSHSLQAVKVEGFLLFKELDGNIAVCLHTGNWQLLQQL